MCGIAGFYNLNGLQADFGILKSMVDLQRHRGPDDQGLLLFSLHAGVSYPPERQAGPLPHACEGGIGFNRLSIVDLSYDGHQPMLSPNGKVILAFNGEIYNADVYRSELKNCGVRFRSRTDTEVVLHLYLKYGMDGMLERLNGMFAICVVDLDKREIQVARDHLGVKPFYWAMAGSTVLFGSEVKSFLAHPDFHATLDVDSIDEYLAFRYVAGENYLLKGVRQLRPGFCLRMSEAGVNVRRYWAIPDGDQKLDISRGEAVDQVGQLLRNAVRSQLVADVPVGCQLSGGIDSSLVTVFARAYCNADLQAFSVVFDDPAYSEDRWVSEAACTAQADSHRFLFTDEFFFDTLYPASWHLDQPLNHPNSLGIWLLAQKSRKLVTVLLSGEGADEVFGGYMRFYYAALHSRISPWVPWVRGLPRLGEKVARRFGGDSVSSFISASMWQSPEVLLDLRPEAKTDLLMDRRRSIFAEGHGDHLNNCLKYELQTHLTDLLVRQDKMTMAHALENRVPFLDRELVSFARRMPANTLVSRTFSPGRNRMRATKIVLKDLAGQRFDDNFVYRRKSGFSLPLSRYFANPRFVSLMEDSLLPSMSNRGIVRSDAVRRLWKDLPLMRPEMAESLWVMVAFEIWAQQFLDGASVGGNLPSSLRRARSA